MLELEEIRKVNLGPFFCYPDLFNTHSFYIAGLFERWINNTINRVNHHLADTVVFFFNNYPLDSDLSSGERYPVFEQLGPGFYLRKRL